MNIVSRGLDRTQGALIKSPANRRYLSGFYSSSGILFITGDSKSYLLVDSRYYENAKKQALGCEVILLDDFQTQFNEIIARHKINRISVENRKMTIRELNELVTDFPHVKFISDGWLSETLIKHRLIKSDDEIKKMIAAQRIAEKAFNKLTQKLHEGMTEKQAAGLLNYYMLGLGSQDVSFPTIVASGKNASVAHSAPTDKPLKKGELIIFDFGAVCDGYHSDMSRTVCVGKPSDKQKEVYNAVLSANNDAMKAVREDITGKVIDNIARSTLEAWGYNEFFKHGVGHGVGLEVHEPPSLSPKGEHTLKAGMVVTIEPGVYIPGAFGVRIEDMVAVTENGCINLTKTPKSLIII